MSDKTNTVKIALMLLCFLPLSGFAGPGNIAHKASVEVSTHQGAADGKNAIDGIIGVDGVGEWVCQGQITSWGYIRYPWIKLTWDTPQSISQIRLYDRARLDEHVAGGTLWFSDGSKVIVNSIPNDGTARLIEFEAREVTWVRFEVTDGEGIDIGLSEIEVFPAPDSFKDLNSWVNPFIETTRGRYFYFTPGSRPFGMVATGPHTRNKNQWGGGYNYNSDKILGFGQLHGWMLSGIEIMPTTGNVDPTKWHDGWKSSFSHNSEIAQPGYYRVFLEDHKVWVEQTTTDRVGLFRFRFTEKGEADILTNLGGYLGSSTMADAKVEKVNNTSFQGSFVSTGRFWGGPERVNVYFYIEFDKPFKSFDRWQNGKVTRQVSQLNETSELTRRFAETYGGITQSYWDTQTAGVSANYSVEAGELVHMRIGISFTSMENARLNLKAECDHWDFDRVVEESQIEWNDILGKMTVKGGSEQQTEKFYTDLWHVLLGRQIINDISGEYPDYTDGVLDWKFTDAKMKVRELPRNDDGDVAFNMYTSDGVWLSQWNLNVLWGLAWPEIHDDFASSFVQYADNGGLLPRGPCVGGYSYIMTGCPATNLITSAFQKGILTRVDSEHAFESIKRNHMPGGMLGEPEHIDFYTENGWRPGNAGETVEWALQDWAAGQMATKLGRTEDFKFFNDRSKGWISLLHPDHKLVLPQDENGNWLHTDLLSGAGWVEANAWQGTWSVSHAIAQLAEGMGGYDTLTAKLNYAFEQAADDDFVFGYSDGYVSYANQPGCSNAHVFSYAGKPWLTQYWVRRVNEQAYGGVTPERGYGGHDEDQGQMGGVSALMSIGMFSLRGNMSTTPVYDITSPVFDEISITLNQDYYEGASFTIKAYDNSDSNMYIRKAHLNGQPLDRFWITHDEYTQGGVLELWMSAIPNKDWGSDLSRLPPSSE